MIINIEHIHKSFGTRNVIKDLSFQIEENSFTVIAGPSGCGKSTLLNMIGLLDQPDSGNITILGKTNIKPNSKEAHRMLKNHIGYLFQNFALVEEQTVSYNLDIALESTKKTKREEMKKEALKQVGLSEEILNKKVFQCSGGEQQRVSVARLLLKPCDLVLADEPTGSLDEENKLQVYALLRNLQKKGKTILIVTHDSSMISMADNVITL